MAYAVYVDRIIPLPKEYGKKSLMQLGFPVEGICYIYHSR